MASYRLIASLSYFEQLLCLGDHRASNWSGDV